MTWHNFRLDQYQQKCVLDDSARVLIIARAGSGKTHTMVAKALYLVTEKGLRPEELEFLAFNRKAAAEINERLNRQIDGLKLADTFHAFALRLSGVASGKVIENLENPDEEDESLFDYKQVFALAAEKIEKLRGDYSIRSQGRIIYPNRLKYLIIDEYQDFTAEYYQVIQAILKHNPFCKLVCIGDDWQAINGFAGAQVEFLINFKNYFPEAKILHLPVNYRCAKKIVEAASNFISAEYLNGRREHKITAARKNRAVIKIVYEKKIQEIGSNGYLGKLGGILRKQARKLCQKPEHKIAILTRCNKVYKRSLDYLRLQVNNFLEQYGLNLNIDISTIHKYKGKQADTVIVFPAVKKIIPLKGNDPAEEKRLFYVAVTRAKDELYFLTEAEECSPYLPSLKRNLWKEWQDKLLALR